MSQWPEEMRRAAQVAREHGHEEIARGNEELADHIERLETFESNAAMLIRRMALNPGHYSKEEVDAALKRWGYVASPLRSRGKEGGGG